MSRRSYNTIKLILIVNVAVIAIVMARLLPLRVVAVLLLASLGAACEEDDDGTEEEQDHRGQTSPHAVAVEGMTSTAIRVDMILNNL